VTTRPTLDPGSEEPEANPGRSRKVLIILLVFIGVMGALWSVGPLVFAGRDDPTAIDNKAVRNTVQASCTQLRADLAALPAAGAPADRAEAENRAVEQFTGRIRALGPDALAKDEPVERWLGDWEQIVAARRQAVRNGRQFSTPIAGGAPINVRMFALVRSGLGKCDVPPALLSPEPGRV
jgi:hypothetical protein